MFALRPRVPCAFEGARRLPIVSRKRNGLHIRA